MKDRIKFVQDSHNMTQQEFAAKLQISPASLSNIYNGRTSPTSNHVKAIHRCFPEVNINWLMFGEGTMMSEDAQSAAAAPQVTPKPQTTDSDLFSEPTMSSEHVHHAKVGYANDAPRTEILTEGTAASAPGKVKEIVKYIDRPPRRITEIRVFFSDGTYESYTNKIEP